MTRAVDSGLACRSVRCPTCGASRGEHCHESGDYRRKPVRWTHLRRRRLWEAEHSGVQNWTQ